MGARIEYHMREINDWVQETFVEPGDIYTFEQFLIEGQREVYFVYCHSNNNFSKILKKVISPEDDKFPIPDNKISLVKELREGKEFKLEVKPDPESEIRLVRITQV